ncbi:MAG: enoyl-CoA hydratase/isomerase family protein [Bacteroidales bacterium]
MIFPFKTIRLTSEKGVYTLTLNRPEAKNALNRLMISEMTEAVMEAADNSTARLLVFDHEGDVFCAGADLTDLSESTSREEGLQYARLLFDLLESIEKCPFPVIVSAHGNVYGGGIGILAAADISFLTENCRLCFSEVKIGMVPAVISAFVLRKVSSGRARELMLTAREFDAREALEYGIVSFVISPENEKKHLDTILQSLLSNKQKAMAACKNMIFTTSRISWLGAVKEYSTSLFADLLLAQEAREAIASFVERKKQIGGKQNVKNRKK